MSLTWSMCAKKAKECRSKTQWESFELGFLTSPPEGSDEAAVRQIYRAMKKDVLNFNFTPKLWNFLIEKAAQLPNDSLAVEIAESYAPFVNVGHYVTIAETFRKASKHSRCQKFIQTVLKRTGIAPIERINLKLVLAISYVETRKKREARCEIEASLALLNTSKLPFDQNAKILSHAAEGYFFLSQSNLAGQCYEKAAQAWMESGDTYRACVCLFNAAANWDNLSIVERKDCHIHASRLVNEASLIAKENHFKFVEGACELFFAVRLFNEGKYRDSNNCVRRALKCYPLDHDRIQHINALSQLVSNYIQLGEFSKAKKALDRVKRLLENEEAKWGLIRVIRDEALLLEESGYLDQSIELLEKHLTNQKLSGPGGQPVEWKHLELSYVRLSLLVGRMPKDIVGWHNWLKSENIDTDLELATSVIRILTERGEYGNVEKILRSTKIQEIQSNRFDLLIAFEKARGEFFLVAQYPLDALKNWHRDFENLCNRSGDGKTNNDALVFGAAIAYREGRVDSAAKLLQKAKGSRSGDYAQRLCVDYWWSSLSGYGPNLANFPEWKLRLFERMTRIYFPTKLSIEISSFVMRINDRPISFARKRQLWHLLVAVLRGEHGKMTFKGLREEVWNDLKGLPGWRSRIERTLVRLRREIPIRSSPLFMVKDSSVHLLNSVTVEFCESSSESHASELIVRLSKGGIMSSSEIAHSMQASFSTVKRRLKELVAGGKVTKIRIGRKVLYRLATHSDLLSC